MFDALYMQIAVNVEAEPSVFVCETQQPNIDYEKLKREKQDLKEKAATLMVRAKSEKLKREAGQKGISPRKVMQGNPNAICRAYDPFASYDKGKHKVLIEFLKTCPEVKKKNPNEDSTTYWYRTLRKERKWLHDTHIDAAINLMRLRYHMHPEWFRSERLSFLDTIFSTLWRDKYTEFLDSADENGGGRILPPGAYDFYCGKLPEFCRSLKMWGAEVDDIYTSLHIKGDHWVAMWISIPTRHIVIWDSSYCYAKDEEVTAAVYPICHMMAYVMHTLALPEEKHIYPNVPYSHIRIAAAHVPQNILSGDCGVFCVKYIECHALGMAFPSYLCDSNIKSIREKLAVEIYDELKLTGMEKREYHGLDMYDSR